MEAGVNFVKVLQKMVAAIIRSKLSSKNNLLRRDQKFKEINSRITKEPFRMNVTGI